jgi:hypothetical protein
MSAGRLRQGVVVYVLAVLNVLRNFQHLFLFIGHRLPDYGCAGEM